MNRQQLREIRFQRFLALLAHHGGSPKRFCEATGYKSETTISQLKNRQKAFGADLAREIAEAAGLHPLALEANGPPPDQWPFTFSYDDYMRLTNEQRYVIDDALTKIVRAMLR